MVLLAVVGFMMAILVICVSAWPARRAARTEPITALKAE
jgi:ABC-type antimicrobial peptide transport system permease subunit